MAGPDDVAFNGEKRAIESVEEGVTHHRGLQRLGVLGPGMHAYIVREEKREIPCFGCLRYRYTKAIRKKLSVGWLARGILNLEIGLSLGGILTSMI